MDNLLIQIGGVKGNGECGGGGWLHSDHLDG